MQAWEASKNTVLMQHGNVSQMATTRNLDLCMDVKNSCI